jgi:hypothetical protein
MSLAWLRRSSRAVAAIILLTSLWQLPHRSQDDEICVPAGTEAHDESKHVFTSPSAPAHQDHCAVCHWVRWMKPVFASTALSGGNTGPDSELAPVTASLLRDAASQRRPARAPPAL